MLICADLDVNIRANVDAKFRAKLVPAVGAKSEVGSRRIKTVGFVENGKNPLASL